MTSKVVKQIHALFDEQAYDRGHHAGEEEVDAIAAGLKADFEEIAETIAEMERILIYARDEYSFREPGSYRLQQMIDKVTA
jgi:hypothetical protein